MADPALPPSGPSTWLEPALRYVPRWIEYQMRQTTQPGCVIAVAHRGAIIFEQAFGFANLATAKRMSLRHRFRIASHSKSFTAAGILRLRELGRLRLDDPVGQHVGGLHPEIAAATIAQVLSHTAGLFRDGDDTGFWRERRPFPDAAGLRAHLAEKPAIAANTRLKYSNYGFALAGLVIEAASGEPYADWMRREIIAPAGLHETEPDITDGVRLATGHSGMLPLGRRVTIAGDARADAYAPAGGFVATAADTARFFAQLSPAAATSPISVESRREMVRGQWREAHSSMERSYGLGTISGRSDGLDWFGHTGGFPGTLSRTCVVPAHELSISVMTNAIDGPSQGWMDGILSILARFANDGAPAPALADWTGRWWSLWRAIDLVPVGGRVLVATPSLMKPLDYASEIEAEGDEGRIVLAGSFGSHGEPARLQRGSDSLVDGVWLAGDMLVREAQLG